MSVSEFNVAFNFVFFSWLLPYLRHCPKLLSYNHLSHAHPAKTDQPNRPFCMVNNRCLQENRKKKTFWVIVIQTSDQTGQMPKLI